MKRINDMPLMADTNETINICHPFIGSKAIEYMTDTLSGRWIGQGPKVDLFEQKFNEKFGGNKESISVNSGTSALHLAYVLCDLKPGDEVVVPLFTCTATNIPFLNMGINLKFADVDVNTLNMDLDHVESLITDKTKAIVPVHYGGLCIDMDRLSEIAGDIPIIQDAAHSIGTTYKGKHLTELSDYVMYSFQAIKHFTTGDGGMLLVNKELEDKAKRIRWFGIDRKAKQGGIWENDITEIGYKYQMTDVAAAIGLAGLEEIDSVLEKRKELFKLYCDKLTTDVTIVGGDKQDEHGAWLFTIYAKDRYGLQSKLAENKIESNQMHFRNDRYTIFEKFTKGIEFPNMDKVEDDYLVLPLHHKMSTGDVIRVCETINEGW
jgi:perosamine synthetase